MSGHVGKEGCDSEFCHNPAGSGATPGALRYRARVCVCVSVSLFVLMCVRLSVSSRLAGQTVCPSLLPSYRKPDPVTLGPDGEPTEPFNVGPTEEFGRESSSDFGTKLSETAEIPFSTCLLHHECHHTNRIKQL